MTMEPKLVYNAIRTPDGTVLVSRHRHDYKSYVDEVSKEAYMVDGGTDYTRRTTGQKWPYEELSLYTTDPIFKVREVFTWGTYGKNADKPLTYILLKDMSIEHIKNVIRLPKQSETMVFLFTAELVYRIQQGEY